MSPRRNGSRNAADGLRQVQAALFAEVDTRHAIIVPLTARGRTLGAITLAHATDEEITDGDLELAEDIARRRRSPGQRPSTRGQRNAAETHRERMADTHLALLLANSALSGTYDALVHAELRLGVGELSITEDVQHWVDDALMVIFLFLFVAGLEIERELVSGELPNRRAAALPAVAALGGVELPA